MRRPPRPSRALCPLCSDCYRIDAPQRHDATCQSLHFALQEKQQPSRRQTTRRPTQNPSSDESLEVITTLTPVETRLAENPPSPRPQISAKGGKETPARRRDFTAFISEYDVPHGYKCISNSDP